MTKEAQRALERFNSLSKVERRWILHRIFDGLIGYRKKRSGRPVTEPHAEPHSEEAEATATDGSGGLPPREAATTASRPSEKHEHRYQTVLDHGAPAGFLQVCTCGSQKSTDIGERAIEPTSELGTSAL